MNKCTLLQGVRPRLNQLPPLISIVPWTNKPAKDESCYANRNNVGNSGQINQETSRVLKREENVFTVSDHVHEDSERSGDVGGNLPRTEHPHPVCALLSIRNEQVECSLVQSVSVW